MTRTVRQLLTLAADLGLVLPQGCTVRRTRAGRWQRSAGAWSWWLEDSTGREVLAGFEPAGRLIEAHRRGERIVLYRDPRLVPPVTPTLILE